MDLSTHAWMITIHYMAGIINNEFIIRVDETRNLELTNKNQYYKPHLMN